jgi:hypothetical protein
MEDIMLKGHPLSQINDWWRYTIVGMCERDGKLLWLSVIMCWKIEKWLAHIVRLLTLVVHNLIY